MDPEDGGHWFQWRVQELVRSLQQAGSRGRDRERERGRTSPPPQTSTPTLAGRLRQFAQQQPPRLRRLFSSGAASAPSSAPGSPLRRPPPVLERAATASAAVGLEPETTTTATAAATASSPSGPALAPEPRSPRRPDTPVPTLDEPEPEPAPVQVEVVVQPPPPEDAAMDVTASESASVSASVDGEVPSIVLEPALGRDADSTGSPAALTDGAHSEGARTPRLHLSLQPADDGAGAAHRKSPVTVQEWVDSLPPSHSRNEEECEELPVEDGEEALDLGLGAEAGLLYNGCPPVTIVSPSQPCVSPNAFGAVCDPRVARQREVGPGLVRESSVQSDVTSHGSHGSSVDSYLESRKPDPEEVLLNLGFGGPPVTENEVSRIPRRFLQPSKVKGVAIDDFLRYQQDLIENFETGFCGYRGLTGSSHTPPSVIVAKIREKLRGAHSLSLSLSEEGGSSAPASEAPRRRFSRAARRVLRTLPHPHPQDSHLSVLTPDNRRFLDNQGRNKSPDVPRKRIVFGARSFTFAGDGDLVEVAQAQLQSPAAAGATSPTPQPPPMPGRARPRPLIHKDSVLSSATSLSMTSLDSDSDTDEGSFERHHVNLQSSHPRLATPLTYNSSDGPPQTIHTVVNTTGDSDSSVASGTVQRPRFSKRISSTSISSWESESPHARFQLQSPTFDSPTNSSRPVRYESIDEDVEMTFSGTMQSSADVSEDNINDYNMSEVNQENEKVSKDEVRAFDVNNEKDYENEHHISEMYTEIIDSPVKESGLSQNSVGYSDTQTVQSDQERLLLRRSSLKRQNRVTDENVIESDTTSKIEALSANESVPVLKFTIHETDQQVDDGLCGPTNSIERDGSQETLVAVPRSDSSNHDTENDVQQIQNQFLQLTKESGKGRVTHTSELNTLKQEQSSGCLISATSGTGDESFEMEELMPCDEETNGEPLLLARTRSDSSGFLEGERSPPPQAPSADTSLPGSDTHVHPPPIGGCANMFSSCSDESVVHVPSRDLQELLDELAGRGLDLPDSASFACQTAAEQQMEAVHMALETFSEQLATGGKTKMLDVEGATDQIKKQIASELRHVAALLEEQPESQAATAITRQVTALLKEQTRLCRQLEMLTGCSDERTNSFNDAAPSTSHCCCESERMFEFIREENRRLERIVETHSAELAEIRQILTNLLDRGELSR